MRLLILVLTLIYCVVSPAGAAELAKLKTSDNHRFIVTADGKPFFYLGDTAWELFHRLDRSNADKYLEKRAQQGFTVIQAVAIAEFDGHTVPNAYGHLPLTDLDPARPAIKDGPDNDYWDHVDYIVDKANANGLHVGFLPTWGRYWHFRENDARQLFSRQNAEVYGEWLGKRYKNKAIVWILGGDRSVDTDEHREIIRAMARGLRNGDGGNHLITFHPNGGQGSSKWFHNDDWLDFNMRQNGHGLEFTGRYDQTTSRFRPDADQAGDRRRTYLRRPPDLVQREKPGPFHRRRRSTPPLLGSFQRGLRTHLRSPFGVGVLETGRCTGQRSSHALDRSTRSARCESDDSRTAAN